ncbi:uncharacterized protein LOC107798197 [Nicotiana tabacum]|uniref:Uncharacterized protein LOC107798197 n=1 Tax=Nicotiana tabacum TaxID=4097 RepID=A0AC58TPG8_TOBAC
MTICTVSFKSRYYDSDGSYKKNKQPLSETDRNVNMREKDKAMSAEKKQKLLLQRRLKYQESKTCAPAENITVDCLNGIMDPPECSTTTSYILHPAFTTSEDHPPPSTSGNERDVVQPLSIYEKGSTSAAPGELRNKDSEIVTCTGRAPTTKFAPITGLLRSNYVPLKKIPICKFCAAKRFEYEPPAFCFGSGTIKTYNNLFAFTSLGVKYDKDLAKRNFGIYTFRVQGKMHHWINNLHPIDDKPRNIQLYFYDNSNELAHRMACSDKIHESVVKELMDILSINPYSVFLRSLVHVSNLQDFHIALKCDLNLDQRVYNLPTSSEIAAIWTEENDGVALNAPHILIYPRTDRTQIVNYYYGCYDALQYPLLFPLGQSGWHCGIKKLPVNCPAYLRTAHHEEVPSIRNVTSLDGYLEMEAKILKKGQRRRDTVSVREYYCYKLQMRNDDEDEILHTGRIFQQYSVDEYIKLETQRLDFAAFNQDLFRTAMLEGLLDILRLEIKEHLIPTDESHNRPDLISRVFREKIEEFKKDILKRNIFGKVAAFMYTVEFQKRAAYNNIISAEIPDENAEPDLHSLVLKHMMHGPCGNLNPTNSCMKKKGYCKFDCHLNVEICSDIKVVKYLYKYICKGHDKIAFSVHNNDTNAEIDEIKAARWVSPPEAMWRLSSANVDTLVNNPLIKQTMLTQFFEMNRTNAEAMELNLLYQEFPEHFVWSSTEKMWTPRKQRHAIGRVVTCHPTEGERYYLRMLLMNIRGPKSYKDLLTVNGERCSTFRESVGLQSDNSLLECMSEAASYQMPYSLRRLFATLLIYCNPTNPRQLWEQFEEHMSEDYTLVSNINKKIFDTKF